MALFFSIPDVVDKTPAHFLGVPHGHKHPGRARNTDERSDRQRAAPPHDERAGGGGGGGGGRETRLRVQCDSGKKRHSRMTRLARRNTTTRGTRDACWKVNKQQATRGLSYRREAVIINYERLKAVNRFCRESIATAYFIRGNSGITTGFDA